MNVPKNIIIQTKEYVQIVTKVNLYISLYGCEAVNQYLNMLPLKWSKKNGRNIGGYIINKVCQEYQITKYELFESNGRGELTEARQLLCVLVDKYMDFNHQQISHY